MKKVFCSVMALLLILTLCACAEKTNGGSSESDTYEIDVAYQLSHGSISEADYALGTDPEKIKSDYAEGDKSEEATYYDDESSLEIIEGGVSFRMVTGSMTYYYNKGKESSGISMIVDMDTAYGFTVGYTTEDEVKECVFGLTGESRSALTDELFFMPIDLEGASVLVYKSGDNTLKFFFSEGTLFATTLENKNWSIKG